MAIDYAMNGEDYVETYTAEEREAKDEVTTPPSEIMSEARHLISEALAQGMSDGIKDFVTVPQLEKMIAEEMGFSKPSEALHFVRFNHVDIAFLDISMGKTSGLDLCEQMIEINPKLNVVFLTAYPEYSLQSWNTHACGFLVKPLVSEEIKRQMSKLRFPVSGLALTEQDGNV